MKIDLCQIYIDINQNKEVICPVCKKGKLKKNSIKSPYVVICEECNFKIHSC